MPRYVTCEVCHDRGRTESDGFIWLCPPCNRTAASELEKQAAHALAFLEGGAANAEALAENARAARRDADADAALAKELA